MKTTTKKKPVVEQAPTVAQLQHSLSKQDAYIDQLISENAYLNKELVRERANLDKTIDSLLNVTKCQK